MQHGATSVTRGTRFLTTASIAKAHAALSESGLQGRAATDQLLGDKMHESESYCEWHEAEVQSEAAQEAVIVAVRSGNQVSQAMLDELAWRRADASLKLRRMLEDFQLRVA